MIHTPMDTKAMIEKATGGLELVTEGDTSYYKRTTLSLTGLLTIFKSSLAVKRFRGIYSKSCTVL
jgi:hypothetical protein